jgi:hypothetical protein
LGSCHNRRVHGRQPSITTRTYISSSTTWKAGISSFRLAYRKPSSLLGNKVRQAPELWYAYSRSAGTRPNRKSQFLCCETRPPAGISYESRVFRPHNRNSSTQCNECNDDRRVPVTPEGDGCIDETRLSGSFNDKKQVVCSNTRRELENNKKEKGEKKCHERSKM